MSHCNNLYAAVIDCPLANYYARQKAAKYKVRTLFLFVRLNEAPTAVMRFAMT